MRGLKYIWLVGVFALSSCGVFNRVSKGKILAKVKDRTEISTESKVDVQVTDKTITTITESATAEVETPRTEGKGSVKVDNLSEIAEGLTLLDDEFLTLTQIYDKKDSVLTTAYIIKPQKVDVPTERKTVIQSDIVTASTKLEQAVTKVNTNTVNREAIVERKPDYTVVIGIGVIVLVVLLFLWLKFKR